ncbi:MAG: aminoglycoside phosphotransferase family protein [Oscillospiraceae bacterium]|nr:aminoglycoside phosphotransferase family protein [Oscillospiraceae bacterium]
MDKEKIIRHFGAAFYEKMLKDLKKYMEVWRLSNLEQIDFYSVNCLFKCFSDTYGPCVLKIGNPSKETQTEADFLREYAGTRFCHLYEAAIADGVLLLEHITPGIPLRAEPDLGKRLDVFCAVSRGLHKKLADKALYPTYMGWVSRITNYMQSRKDYKILYEKMTRAEQLCRSLCEAYPGEMLLHGDLYHDNILLGKNNGYRIIDPKGIVGDVVFDIPRFILNEFPAALNNDFDKKFAHIIRTLSRSFHIPERDIRRLTYVEMCMAHCWNVESGEKPLMDEVVFAENQMKETL